MGFVGQLVESIAWSFTEISDETSVDSNGLDDFARRRISALGPIASIACAMCKSSLPQAVFTISKEGLPQDWPMHRGRSETLCGNCWLCGPLAPGSDSNLQNLLLNIPGGDAFVQQILLIRSAPFAPNNQDDPKLPSRHGNADSMNRKTWPGRCLPLDGSAAMTLIWDALSPLVAAAVKAIRIEFPDMCKFLEVHEAEGIATLFATYPSLADAREKICRSGGLSAVLASEVFISNCEENPKVLFFELLYRHTVRLPPLAELAQLEAEYLQPMQKVRWETVGNTGTDPCRWWLHPHALHLISRSLDRNHFAIIDGFLPDADAQTLRDSAAWLWESRQMHAGVLEQQGNYGGYWGNENEGDFQNTEGVPRKWAMEGDQRIWISDTDDRAKNLQLQFLTQNLDNLLTALKNRGVPALGVSCDTAIRLSHADFRESTMVTCYPGAMRGRYLRHCDTGRGAVLTAIFYLNECWNEQDGGELRLYDEGFHNTQIKYDVLPILNRLLLFWATEECPHEVLPTKRDRFAMTVWCRNSYGLDVQDLLETALRCTPVAPLSLEAAVIRAGPPEEEDARRQLLTRFNGAAAHGDPRETYLRQSIPS